MSEDHARHIKIPLSSERKNELEKQHDKTRDDQVRDRIKALLLASEGWTAKKIAQALRIHEATVHRPRDSKSVIKQ